MHSFSYLLIYFNSVLIMTS